MIFPISHEDMTARRWPIATTAIILLCFIIYPITSLVEAAMEPQLEKTAVPALEFFEAHPNVKACPLVQRLAEAHKSQSDYSTVGIMASNAPIAPADQSKMDALCDDLDRAAHELPTFRFGYIPAENNLLGLVTSQFLHGGWFHLIFNMWFLWLCGCNLEDKWGRAVFVPFYLISGVVAALAHKLAVPNSVEPLIGASGAIAGAMGAFLVSFAKTRIRFVYWIYLRPGMFSAPAYVMLPLWLLENLVWGLVDVGDGVAYWAHVGGFAFGLSVAIALRVSGWDRKLDEAVEREVSFVQDDRIVRAGELTTQGKAHEAIPLLDAVLAEKPASVDVQLELVRAARALGDTAREGRAGAKLVGLYLDQNHVDAAAETYVELGALEGQLPRPWRIATADRFIAAGRPDRAEAICTALMQQGLVDSFAVRAAVSKARIVARLGRVPEARELYASALESPFADADLATSIGTELAALQSKDFARSEVRDPPSGETQ
jgi:membrane associated rhomboid family serine protease